MKYKQTFDHLIMVPQTRLQALKSSQNCKTKARESMLLGSLVSFRPLTPRVLLSPFPISAINSIYTETQAIDSYEREIRLVPRLTARLTGG